MRGSRRRLGVEQTAMTRCVVQTSFLPPSVLTPLIKGESYSRPTVVDSESRHHSHHARVASASGPFLASRPPHSHAQSGPVTSLSSSNHNGNVAALVAMEELYQLERSEAMRRAEFESRRSDAIRRAEEGLGMGIVPPRTRTHGPTSTHTHVGPEHNV